MSLQYQSERLDSEDEVGVSRDIAKILVVDDSPEILEVISHVLTLSGFAVTTVCSVDEAIASLTTSVPDLIVCDVLMPERDGYALHEEICRNPDWCELPFIFLTAVSGDEAVRDGKSLGCDEYLTKPFDPEDLVAVVKGKVSLAKRRQKMSSVKMEGYRRRIIHTLSHEFRTPLVSINTGTELLIEQHSALNQSQIIRLLESIWRGGQRLERLVDDFMLLQQIDLGHAAHTYELYKQRYPLVQLVRSAVDGFSDPTIRGAAAQMEVVIAEESECEDMYVQVYDVQIHNVLQRLLSNAQKFGGSDNRISVSIGRVDHLSEVVVRDRGPGLQGSEGILEEASTAFSQIDRETFEQQGCGLGLTIARYFSRINGAALSFRAPKEGPGLEAVLTIPLVSSRKK
jgi:CheY-like chemotaxis protein